MDRDTENEIQRLDNSLLKFCPSRKWEILALTFPATANTDLDIAHTLNADNPEAVGFQILQASQPCLVWKDTSTTRTSWSLNVVRLRCTAPSAKVVLLLTVQANPLSADTNTAPTAFTIGPSTSAATLGTVGSTSFAGDTWIGPGVKMVGVGAGFDVGVKTTGAGDFGLMVTDNVNGMAPLVVRRFSGAYYVQPGKDSRTAGMVASLGNPNDAASSGLWDNAYINEIYASNGLHERGRTARMGEPTAVTYASGDYTCNGADTWTVASGDVTNFEYWELGKLLGVDITLDTTSITAGTATTLSIKIPNSKVAAKGKTVPCVIFNNSSTVFETGIAQVSASGTTIDIFRPGFAAFSISANLTFIRIAMIIKTT